MTRIKSQVALDISAGVMDEAGTGTYTRHLAEALSEVLGDEFFTLANPAARRRSSPRTIRDRALTIQHDTWWTQYGCQRAAATSGARLLHFPTGIGPIRPAVRSVITIHDLAVFRFPDRFRTWFRHYARVVMPRAARTAAAVITISEASKADIVERLSIPEGRITVVPNGVEPEFAEAHCERASRVEEVRRRYDLPESFVLTVGSIEPRKNLLRMVHALHRLHSEPGLTDLTLVHAGPYGWLADDVRRLVASLGLDQAVRFLGFVPRDDLPGLYLAARCFAYPSLFEGFGLPVLEAMAVGCPVLTSTVSSLPEVAGNAALLVDPESIEAIADGIQRLWTDPDLRLSLTERGRTRATGFSWDRAARSTADVYARVLQS